VILTRCWRGFNSVSDDGPSPSHCFAMGPNPLPVNGERDYTPSNKGNFSVSTLGIQKKFTGTNFRNNTRSNLENYGIKAMHKAVKALRNFGFTEGFSVIIPKTGKIPKILPPSDVAKREIVYVALLDNGVVLKVGISKGGLWNRWKGILKVMGYPHNNHSKRPNEQSDGRKLLAHARGRKFTVWYKDSLWIKLPYARDKKFPAYGAEEIFFDQYFKPLFGRKLNQGDPHP